MDKSYEGQVREWGRSYERQKGSGTLGRLMEMALEVMSINLQPSALPLESPLFWGATLML